MLLLAVSQYVNTVKEEMEGKQNLVIKLQMCWRKWLHIFVKMLDTNLTCFWFS